GGATYRIASFERVLAMAKGGEYASIVFGSDSVDVLGVQSIFDDGTGGVTFDGRGGDDLLTGSKSADRIDGGAGNDIIAGG
ncbi:hypothetical protein RSW32_26060, partial [Escherichia coli]|nr:hypothetical protein [Escherichia coli]